ncbi:MAG TPA: hypothetical protein VIM57_08490 [Luteolibacter sp.]
MAVSVAPKQKEFLYKCAQFLQELGSTDDTLESMLKRSLAMRKKASERMEAATSQDLMRFVNYRLDHQLDNGGSIYGCEFLAYEKGADQSTIKLDENAEEVDVQAIPAGPDKEFLAGSVYFAVSGNHVVLFQSRGLKTQELESYLNWLIRENTRVLDSENAILLADNVTETQRESIKGAKGIRLKSPVKMEPDEVRPQTAVGAEARSIRVKPHGRAWSAFKQFFTEHIDLPNGFNVEDLAGIPHLEMELFLHWKGRRDESGPDFLDAIAMQMRHVDDEFDYSIETNTGSITRNEIKIHQKVSVPWTPEGRPKFDVLFPKMATWLAKLIAENRVNA